jgi:hypothetical protein
MVAFKATAAGFEFVVCGRGIGVLQSLRTCSDDAHLADHGQAGAKSGQTGSLAMEQTQAGASAFIPCSRDSRISMGTCTLARATIKQLS